MTPSFVMQTKNVKKDYAFDDMRYKKKKDTFIQFIQNAKCCSGIIVALVFKDKHF